MLLIISFGKRFFLIFHFQNNLTLHFEDCFFKLA